jgi:UDP-2-acetamido-3-amino-2,3-dideoxy-glucuronate N-acetyltransferase
MINPQITVGPNTKIWHEHLSNIGACQIGDYCIIHSNVWIGNEVVIGDCVKIQAFSFIPTGVVIEDGVFIGPHVCFTNDKHPPSGGKGWAKTLVKSRAVIGANATILPGITIGEGSTIGAGSVVTKDVPDFATVYGNPARAKGEA